MATPRVCGAVEMDDNTRVVAGTDDTAACHLWLWQQVRIKTIVELNGGNFPDSVLDIHDDEDFIQFIFGDIWANRSAQEHYALASIVDRWVRSGDIATFREPTTALVNPDPAEWTTRRHDGEHLKQGTHAGRVHSSYGDVDQHPSQHANPGSGRRPPQVDEGYSEYEGEHDDQAPEMQVNDSCPAHDVDKGVDQHTSRIDKPGPVSRPPQAYDDYQAYSVDEDVRQYTPGPDKRRSTRRTPHVDEGYQGYEGDVDDKAPDTQDYAPLGRQGPSASAFTAGRQPSLSPTLSHQALGRTATRTQQSTFSSRFQEISPSPRRSAIDRQDRWAAGNATAAKPRFTPPSGSPVTLPSGSRMTPSSGSFDHDHENIQAGGSVYSPHRTPLPISRPENGVGFRQREGSASTPVRRQQLQPQSHSSPGDTKTGLEDAFSSMGLSPQQKQNAQRQLQLLDQVIQSAVGR